MADEEEKNTFENQEKDSFEQQSNSEEKNPLNLKTATAKLKAEALRRYQLKEAEENDKAVENQEEKQGEKQVENQGEKQEENQEKNQQKHEGNQEKNQDSQPEVTLSSLNNKVTKTSDQIVNATDPDKTSSINASSENEIHNREKDFIEKATHSFQKQPTVTETTSDNQTKEKEEERFVNESPKTILGEEARTKEYIDASLEKDQKSEVDQKIVQKEIENKETTSVTGLSNVTDKKEVNPEEKSEPTQRLENDLEPSDKTEKSFENQSKTTKHKEEKPEKQPGTTDKKEVESKNKPEPVDKKEEKPESNNEQENDKTESEKEVTVAKGLEESKTSDTGLPKQDDRGSLDPRKEKTEQSAPEENFGRVVLRAIVKGDILEDNSENTTSNTDQVSKEKSLETKERDEKSTRKEISDQGEAVWNQVGLGAKDINLNLKTSTEGVSFEDQQKGDISIVSETQNEGRNKEKVETESRELKESNSDIAKSITMDEAEEDKTVSESQGNTSQSIGNVEDEQVNQVVDQSQGQDLSQDMNGGVPPSEEVPQTSEEPALNDSNEPSQEVKDGESISNETKVVTESPSEPSTKNNGRGSSEKSYVSSPLQKNNKTTNESVSSDIDNQDNDNNLSTEDGTETSIDPSSQENVSTKQAGNDDKKTTDDSGDVSISTPSQQTETDQEDSGPTKQVVEPNQEKSDSSTPEDTKEEKTVDGVSSKDSVLSKTSSTQIGEYHLEDHASKPLTTSDVPANLLTLYHSFGYECTKRSNLHILSPDHVIFSAGNTFQILNLKTKQQINMRSTSGGGVGAIAVHPSRNYFAVSEKGKKPNIVIYEYPSFKIHRILREGTEEAYSNLDFSPSGEKLASVGSYPDYMMTIWDWKKEKIILRSKAFSQDIYKVAFSPEDEGHLCSSGTGHIKFWTMANTFTGLKLQGDLGRFGTTELSDISGFVELPDGKVLSGSEWGNMLLWDGGLIKAELTRKGKKTCHQGNIEQFFLDEGEMITVGNDGYVKVWDFESIDNADSQDESKLFEIEPMSELKVGVDVKLLSMIKSVDEEETSVWYAQDGNGGIWSLDLSFSHTSQAPIKLFSYHAGKVNALTMSPIAHVAATTGEDGTVRLYDYFEKSPLCQKKFNTAGHSALWVPKVVDANCSSVLIGFGDGVVRHLTVMTNNKRTAKNPTSSGVALHLTQVFKPHLKAVTAMVIDIHRKILATGSQDGTVFFFQIDKTFKPIGFVEVESEVVSLEWSSVTKGSKLLVVCKDGSIFELNPPRPGTLDTNKTYQLPLADILINNFKFVSVKDEILRKEEEERKAKELQEKQRKQQAELDRRRALGISEEEDEKNEKANEKKDGDDEDEEESEEQQAPVKHPQGNVLKGFYRSAASDNVVITMDGWDAGFFYECQFPGKDAPPKQYDDSEDEELVKAIHIPDINDVPITSLQFSKNGDFLAFGLRNGALRVQNMKRSTLEKLDSYWFLNVHDNHAGLIRDIAISFDNKFLMSVGEDGNIFTFSFIDENALKEFEKNRTKITSKTIETRPVDDIDDPKHYSIELEKQKAEHDKKLRLAEEKKQQAKTIISKLRREFRKLKAKNSELPSYLQLPASDFVIDPQIKIDIEKETEEKIELLKKEAAWESEKHEIALNKLKKRYKDCIECDRIVVYSFVAEHTVSSFRASELSKEFYRLVNENHRRMTIKGATGLMAACKKVFGGRRGQNNRRSSVGKQRRGSVSNEAQEKDEFAHAQKPAQQPAQKLDGKVAKMIEKAEQRKQKRIARQKEWEELYRTKPDETYEDPKDAKSIEHAQKTIGDFKLKTAADFVVPEEERVNAEKKRAELFDLKVKIHDLKEGFNKKLLALRDRKIETIDKIKILVDKLQDVQSKLPERCHVTVPSVPEMKIEEQPEKKLEYTTEMLIDFRKNILGLEVTRIEDIQTGANGGHGNESYVSKPTTRATNDPRLRSTSMISTFSSVPASGSSVVESPDIIEEKEEGDELEIVDEEEKSALQLEIEKEQEIRLTYERNELLAEIRNHLILFDADLRLLRHDKIHLDVKLKNAELRQITLFEEWVLLKEFEKREDMLANKLIVKIKEKDDMEDKVDGCKESLNSKKEELEKLQERETSLLTTLNHTIGDNNKFEAFLVKVFKKKIKRVKKKTSTEGSSDVESEEEDSDDDYDDSDEEDDSDEDELDDSVCPSGCDPAIFDQICSLRERRLDLEELLMETKKSCDTLKKDLDTMVKKVKVIDSAVKSAGADLEAFQREKQQKLNELDVVATLKLDQIQYVINNTLPQDLSQCLVIRGCFLDTLQRRIKELEREKVTEKHLYKERRQQHVQMHRDKKTMQNKIKELQDKVQQIQMLKFGRLVDLEKLETVSVNRVAEELKEKLREQEVKNLKEINNWDKSIDKLQTDLTSLVKANTKRLDTYTILHQKNRDLVKDLDSRQKNLGSEFQGDRKADEVERGRLAQLVQLQASEIQQLEDEINILSRKGGHVLPPQREIPPMDEH